MEEQIILEETGVKVTSARFILPAQTYAVANITSVKNFTQSANQVSAILFGGCGLGCFAIGALCATGGSPGMGLMFAFFGIVSMVAGFFELRAAKPSYHVILATAGGEVRVLSSLNREYIERVVQAANNAIVALSCR